MKVLVWHGPRNMTVEQQEVPKPGPGEALVQVKAVGICGSEIEGYLGQNSLRVPPLIMGHEFSGEIVESGEYVSPFRTGQRVLLAPMAFCNQCEDCSAGRQNMCRQFTVLGNGFDGGNCEYISALQRNVIQRGHPVLAMDCALAGVQLVSYPSAELSR